MGQKLHTLCLSLGHKYASVGDFCLSLFPVCIFHIYSDEHVSRLKTEQRYENVQRALALGSSASLALLPFPLCREHPIGDKSFQSYIRQQSETSTHSI